LSPHSVAGREEAIARAHANVEESFIASSGPGGQNVNKVATAVQLRVNAYALRLPVPVFKRLQKLAGSKWTDAGEILITARSHRTQERNRADARDRLEELLREAFHEPKKRKKSRLNRVGKGKRLDHKKQRGAIKAKRGAVKPGDY
jgi:ribosome-associated protein